jgi:hypothetical protein
VAVDGKLAVDERDLIESFQQLQAAVAIMGPATGVLARKQHALPCNLRTKVRNKLGLDAIAAKSV